MCSAVRNACEDTLHIFLRAVTAAFPGDCSADEAESAYLQLLKEHGGNRVDLWSIAVACCRFRRALALIEHGVPIVRYALLSSAVQADQDMYELVLKSRAWSDEDKRDAFRLRHVHHVYHHELKEAAIRHHCCDLAFNEEDHDEDATSPTLPVDSEALPLFQNAPPFADGCEGGNRSPASDANDSCRREGTHAGYELSGAYTGGVHRCQ